MSRGIVRIDRAYPLVHACTHPDVFRLQRRTFECFVDIGGNCAGFVQRKVAVLKDRDAIEGVERKMGCGTHLRLQITECKRHAFVREHELNDVDKGAARETEHGDISHDEIPL
jgi:hypothetical protein